jgi:hypothetical protein
VPYVNIQITQGATKVQKSQLVQKVTELLQSFGWTDIFDLGDITSASGTEMMMPIWLRAFGKLGNVPYDFKIVVG